MEFLGPEGPWGPFGVAVDVGQQAEDSGRVVPVIAAAGFGRLD